MSTPLRDYAARRNNLAASHLGEGSNFPSTTAPLRKLTVTASSVLLDRFDRTLSKVKKNTLVGDMAVLRSRGFNGHHFIHMVKRTGDPSTQTGLEKLRFLTFGSSDLRYILYQINTYVLPPTSSHGKRKILLYEDVSLSAQFWEMAINLTYVQTALLNAGLTDSERVPLVKRFNDPKDELTILIIMHSVSAQGVNLDRCCSRVIVVTNAINAPTKWQGWGRVLRVSIFSSSITNQRTLIIRIDIPEETRPYPQTYHFKFSRSLSRVQAAR